MLQEWNNRLLKQAQYLDLMDFQMVIMSFLPAGQSNGNSLYFGSDNYFIEVIFNKNGDRINSIKLSENFPIEICEGIELRLKSIISDERVEKIGYTVLFSSFPVKGNFKYKEKFQILPVPPGSPVVIDRFSSSHPFILEYKYLGYSSNENGIININVSNRVRKDLILLLNVAFQPKIVTKLITITDDEWVFVYEEGKEVESKLFQIGYKLKNYEVNESAFTVTDNIKSIEVTDQLKYFPSISSAGLEGELTVETFVLNLLDKYFEELKEDDKKHFNNAAYWLSYAKKHSRDSQSALALFIAMSMEALMKDEKINVECKICGKTIERSKSKADLLKDLLKNHYSFNDENRYITKLFYEDIRSKIAHGGVLHSDKNYGYFYPKINMELSLITGFLEINRKIIVNWLLSYTS